MNPDIGRYWWQRSTSRLEGDKRAAVDESHSDEGIPSNVPEKLDKQYLTALFQWQLKPCISISKSNPVEVVVYVSVSIGRLQFVTSLVEIEICSKTECTTAIVCD